MTCGKTYMRDHSRTAAKAVRINIHQMVLRVRATRERVPGGEGGQTHEDSCRPADGGDDHAGEDSNDVSGGSQSPGSPDHDGPEGGGFPMIRQATRYTRIVAVKTRPRELPGR